MEERFRARNLNFLNADFKYTQQRREAFAVELRRDKRNQMHTKKRISSSRTPTLQKSNSISSIPPDLFQYLPPHSFPSPFFSSPTSDQEKLEVICSALLNSPPPSITHRFLLLINHSLPSNTEVPSLLYNLHLIDPILRLISPNSTNEILLESTYTISVIASGPSTYTSEIVKFQGLDRLLSVISPAHIQRLENILWSLANILHDSSEHVQECINKDIFSRLQRILGDLKRTMNSNLAQALAFVIKSLAMHCSVMKSSEIKELAGLCMHLLDTYENYQLQDCVYGVYYMCKVESNLDLLLSLQVVDCVKRHLYKPELLLPSLKVINAVIAGTEVHTQYMLDNEALLILNTYIETQNTDCLHMILMSLGNIAACSEEINSTLVLHDVFPPALRYLCHTSEEIRLDTSFFLRNFFSLAKSKDKLRATEFNLYTYLAEALSYSEPEYLCNVLCVVYHMLGLYYENPEILQLFEQAGGLVSLTSLTAHPDSNVSDTADALYSRFYDTDNEY